MFEKKFYFCGKCGNIYKKSNIPHIKEFGGVKTPQCCNHPLQMIGKDVKKEIEARNDR